MLGLFYIFVLNAVVGDVNLPGRHVITAFPTEVDPSPHPYDGTWARLLGGARSRHPYDGTDYGCDGESSPREYSQYENAVRGHHGASFYSCYRPSAKDSRAQTVNLIKMLKKNLKNISGT